MIQAQNDEERFVQKPSLALFPDVTESMCAGGEGVVVRRRQRVLLAV